MRDDVLALTGEEDDDGEKKTNEAKGRDEADEPHLIVSLSKRGTQADSSNNRCSERDTQEDGDTLRDRRVAHHDVLGRVADDLDVEEGQGGEEDDLEDAVEGDEDGAVIAVTTGKVRPYEDHGDAAGNADEDEALTEVRPVGEKGPGEGGHEEGGEDPVKEEGDEEVGPEGTGAEEKVQSFVANFAEDGVHHDEEADCWRG